MIYIDVTGRCGNQLFQYAFARKLSVLTGDETFSICFSNVYRWERITGDSTFDDQLQYFHTKAYSINETEGNLIRKYGSVWQNSLIKICRIIRKACRAAKINGIRYHQICEPILNLNGIYYCESDITKVRKTIWKNKFIKGYFEDQLYFDDIRELLINEFTPIYPPKEKNKELYHVINNRESVCVSFRVWNELLNNQEELRVREVCTPEYYYNAIKKMKELHPDACFIVFSNDVDWIREHFNFPGDVFFEDGTDEIWEKLRLMYSCKHFIMSTSTFCWWAQYLCRNPQKTVVSPKQWYADTSRTSKLIQEEWIKVDC